MELSIQTVADALSLPPSTVERWIRQGRIPIQRKGAQAVFSHGALKKWANSHNITFSLENDANDQQASEPVETLVAAMRRGKVFHQVSGTDKSAVLRSAVDCIDFMPPGILDELYKKLMAREGLASTGIGNGIAIPHPRNPLSEPPESPAIATCFLERPVDFDAIDDRPVFVLFLMINPSVNHHLHQLSRLSYCIRDEAFVQFLTTSPAASDLFAHVARSEKQLDAGGRP